MKMTKLAEIRKAKGITQAELAKMVGVNSETIYRYEHGDRQPNITKLQAIATALDCTVSDLI